MLVYQRVTTSPCSPRRKLGDSRQVIGRNQPGRDESLMMRVTPPKKDRTTKSYENSDHLLKFKKKSWGDAIFCYITMKFYDSQNYTAVSFSQSFSIFHHDMVNLS